MGQRRVQRVKTRANFGQSVDISQNRFQSVLLVWANSPISRKESGNTYESAESGSGSGSLVDAVGCVIENQVFRRLLSYERDASPSHHRRRHEALERTSRPDHAHNAIRQTVRHQPRCQNVAN